MRKLMAVMVLAVAVVATGCTDEKKGGMTFERAIIPPLPKVREKYDAPPEKVFLEATSEGVYLYLQNLPASRRGDSLACEEEDGWEVWVTCRLMREYNDFETSGVLVDIYRHPKDGETDITFRPEDRSRLALREVRRINIYDDIVGGPWVHGTTIYFIPYAQ